MAGSINNAGTFWNVGDMQGRNDDGSVVSLPVAATAVGVGSATPTAAPSGAPLYIDSDNDDLYVWDGSAWAGPYGIGPFSLATHSHT